MNNVNPLYYLNEISTAYVLGRGFESIKNAKGFLNKTAATARASENTLRSLFSPAYEFTRLNRRMRGDLERLVVGKSKKFARLFNKGIADGKSFASVK